MLGFYNYTVILTYIGMLTGFAGITFSLNGDPKTAIICLMIAGVCDMFDGKIASTMERTQEEKHFGIQIDSLSDLICFGVLPAVIVCTITGNSEFSYYISGLYVLSALIRLAWFNVDEMIRQKEEEGSREIYQGLPVTSAALILPMALEATYVLGLDIPRLSPFFLMIMGIAFLCPFKLRKPALMGKISMVVMGGAALVAFFFMGFDI